LGHPLKQRQVTKIPSFSVSSGDASLEVYTAFDGAKFTEEEGKCETYISKEFFDKEKFFFDIRTRQLSMAKQALQDCCACTREPCIACVALAEINDLGKSISKK